MSEIQSMSKLTMNFSVGIIKNKEWISSDLYDLSNEDINLITLSLENLLDDYLFINTTATYDKESLNIIKNRPDNAFYLSILVNDDLTVIDTVIKTFIEKYNAVPLYNYNQYSFNNITWGFEKV